MSQQTNPNEAFSEHAFQVSVENSTQAENTSSPTARFADSVQLLSELEEAGLEDLAEEIHDVVSLLSRLANSVQESIACFDDDDESVRDHMVFVVNGCDQIRELALSDDPDSIDLEQLVFLKEEIETRLDSNPSGVDATDTCSGSNQPSEPAAPSADEIADLLSQLQLGEPVEHDATDAHEPIADEPESSGVSTLNASAPTGGEQISPPDVDAVELDEELREAFMDDASKGLASMEEALLQLESDPAAAEPIRIIERELHTIKGASASVGMENLARYIHDVEEYIRESSLEGGLPHQQTLFQHVDVIRCRVEGQPLPSESGTSFPATQQLVDEPPTPINTGSDAVIESAASPQQANASVQTPSVTSPKRSLTEDRTDDETVRVKSSQLNRLMDMLSELVMLRNQRDTELSQLKDIHSDLTYCVTRMRILSHEGESLLASDRLADAELAAEGVSFSRLNEVASDVMESAQRLQECYVPVVDGNQAVTRFIRNFRLELTQLRRMPVAALFRRLHRAISDAARTEKKQVRVELVGEQTGIERSLQERIFEPLLHIVRNSVSHGIESADKRTAKGKSPHGTVTLHAHSGPDLLVIEVRDDGSGLDFDAIRRRGVERGLIESEHSASRGELAQLIFHPGFSTRQVADQLSGRGVGMDVVASTLERMRGWVEVDSETGQGTTIRLSLPLPSMIQHVMVFRSGDQLFALPVTSIARAGDAESYESAVPIRELLGSPAGKGGDVIRDSAAGVIELTAHNAVGNSGSARTVSLLVDEILGPEEVVVRPMPPLLKPHPFCSGATLSGTGEVVLLLDPRQLPLASLPASAVPVSSGFTHAATTNQPRKVLVVDDSKSARLRVVRALEPYGIQIEEFEDGQAAWEALADGSFDAVFSDIDMPRMTGLELLESIKQDTSLQHLPVFMISSRSSETAGKQALELGAAAYLQKPLLGNRLAAAIADLCWAKS